MKVARTILKILAALAAIAGVIYVVATYGDKIVAWAKKLLNCDCCCCCDDTCCCDDNCCCEEDCCCEEACCCEESCCETPAEEPCAQAEETDFEA